MRCERVEVLYSGRVQGVGFRYTTQRIAKQFPVRGWVKNLPDGRVQLAAEGARGALQQFLEAIDVSLGDYVRNRTVDWLASQHEPDGFRIAY